MKLATFAALINVCYHNLLVVPAVNNRDVRDFWIFHAFSKNICHKPITLYQALGLWAQVTKQKIVRFFHTSFCSFFYCTVTLTKWEPGQGFVHFLKVF